MEEKKKKANWLGTSGLEEQQCSEFPGFNFCLPWILNSISSLPYIYLPIVCGPWKPKLLSFALSFLYKFIVIIFYYCCFLLKMLYKLEF